MLYFTSDLKTYNIDASDGEVGKIKDLYFDDKEWSIRYAVIDTRKWLPGRKVLLSPSSFVNLNEAKENLEVEYDKEKVRNSPAIPEGQSLSYEAENSLIGYYGWSRYWMSNAMWGAGENPITSSFYQGDSMEKQIQRDIPQSSTEMAYNLRSEDETMGFKVHANNGKIGIVVDMVYDDEYWNIKYIVVQSNESYVNEKYFIFTRKKIESVDWFGEDIYISEPLESIKQNKLYTKKEDILLER
ncbi:PRC-barrel domain-containing protein [Virgibacillus ainsalahensis]